VVEANGVLLAAYDSLIQAKKSHKADQIAARRARARAMTQEMHAVRSSQARGARNLASRPLTDARQLTSQLDDIAQRYETLPSASLLAEAGQCHASIALLLRYAQSEPMRRELPTVYGRAAIRDARVGLNFAQAAAEHSRGESDALRGLSLLHVGEAYAMLGEHRQCERAAGRELYPWRNEQAVHDVQDRLLALVAGT
jgi:hypothetical protein